MEAKSANRSVAFALLCGLALCATVMYISADGADEIVAEGMEFAGIGPKAIGSIDVQKAGKLYTNTPDGYMHLLTYFEKIEGLIAKENAERVSDIQAIRAHMAKNMEYNEKARKDMKKDLLAKMAANAKQAKMDLAKSMRETQANFAKVAAHENAIRKKNAKQFRATRKLMRKNKREARRNLRAATATQQRALATLASTTNAHIAQTNKHISANAVQIATNAKRAQADLQKAMGQFNDKMANIREEAKKGRSKLVAQAADQDKKFRAYANNAVQAEINIEAKRFAKMRTTMATDRAHADHMMKSMSTKLTGALSAAAALNDKHFKSTVADIKLAKKQADDAVKAASRSFKMQTMQLRATAEEQTKKLKAQSSKLAGTVESNRIAQAATNRNVLAEQSRMRKMGQERFDMHAAKDKALGALIKKNREETKKKMFDMQDSFNNKLEEARAQMKKDRAHAANALKQSTNKLHATLAANDKAQKASNEALTGETARMAKDAADALRDTKLDFATRLSALNARAVRAAKKVDEKMKEATGIVEADALKNAEGRANLKIMADSNKRIINGAINDAINAGEARATAVEANMKKANKASADAISNKIDNDIAELRREVKAALFKVSLDSAASRKAMRKEVLAALKDANKETKDNLNSMVAWSTAEMVKLDSKFEEAKKLGAAQRKTMELQIAADKKHAISELQGAMGAQAKSLAAFTKETSDAIADTNKKIGDQEAQIEKNAKEVAGTIKANGDALQGQLNKAKNAAVTQLSVANKAAADRYAAAIKQVTDGVAAATKADDERFDKAAVDMAADRKKTKANLGTATTELNSAIAQHAALMDRRFTKDLPGEVKSFKDASAKRLADAKVDFGTANEAVLAELKQSEGRMMGDIMTLTGELLSHKQTMARTNSAVAKNVEGVFNLANKHKSESDRFHGDINRRINIDKAAASEEVKALQTKMTTELALVRAKMAADRRQAATDLTDATKLLGEQMLKDKLAQDAANTGMAGDLTAAQAGIAAQLVKDKAQFKTSVNTLTNKITAADNAYKRQMKHVTGISNKYAAESKADRARVRAELSAMGKTMNKAISKAIQLGEARMVEEQSKAVRATEKTKKALVSTIGEEVEKMADTVFATVNSNRQQIADNYVSLKAYAVASIDTLEDYQKKAGSAPLAAVGDFLKSTAALSDVKAGIAAGVGAGASSIPAVFSGKSVKVKNPVNKINFMVNEYMSVLSGCKTRWSLGLGKYLLSRMDLNMQKKGVLEVDKIEGKAGDFVFINAHSVGLSSKLDDFEKLAVPMRIYQSILKKLTAKSIKVKGINKGGVMVKPVYMTGAQWQGDR